LYVLLALLAAVGALKLWLVLELPGFLGVDGGAYLESVNVVMGLAPKHQFFPRPPLAPGWLLAPFTLTLGVDLGMKVWGVLASLLPAIPVYLLARHLTRNSMAGLFAAGLVSLDLLHWEMLTAGSLPFLGFTLIGLALWAVLSLYQWWSWRAAATLALSVGLVPWVNQTSAGLALIVLPIFFASLWGLTVLRYDRMERGPKLVNLVMHVVPPAVVGGIIAAFALPWYLGMGPGSDLTHYHGPWVIVAPFGSYPWWIMATALAAVVLVFRYSREPALRALALVAGLLGGLNLFFSADETVINLFFRARYLLPVVFYPLATWIVWTRWLPAVQQVHRLIAPVGTAAAMALMLVGSVYVYLDQSRYSNMMPYEAVRVLEAVPPGETAIITNSWATSVWVSALTRRPSPTMFNMEPPRGFQPDYARVRCVMGWVDGCDWPQAQRELDAEWVLLDTRYPAILPSAGGMWGAPEHPWAEMAPWLELAHQEGQAKLYRINGGLASWP
jgi:hypothetical protein